jgi:hypothetical protein
LKSVYRRFTDQIAADASRSASVYPHPSAFSWLAGEWTWSGQSVHFAGASYGVSRNADPFLIHNAETGMWILVLPDSDAFGILIGLGMRNGQARFTGDVTINGDAVRLRQTWRCITGYAVEIENERQSDGDWLRWDLAVLERVMPSN